MSGSNPLSHTALTRQVLDIFAPIFEKMGIEAPDHLIPVDIDIDDLRDGVELSLEEIAAGHGEHLSFRGRRTLAYLPDNYSPRVHIRYCGTLRNSQRKGNSSRYIAQLPTRFGFRMANGSYKKLNICRHCESLEAPLFEKLKRHRWESLDTDLILAIIIAEFSAGQAWQGDAVTQMESGGAPSDSMFDFAEQRSISSSFDPYTDEGKKNARESANIERLCRPEFLEKDREFLRRLLATESVLSSDAKKIYKLDYEDARKYFKRRMWDEDFEIVCQSIPGPNKQVFFFKSR